MDAFALGQIVALAGEGLKAPAIRKKVKRKLGSLRLHVPFEMPLPNRRPIPNGKGGTQEDLDASGLPNLGLFLVSP